MWIVAAHEESRIFVEGSSEAVIYHEAGAASKSKNKGEEGFLSPTVHF